MFSSASKAWLSLIDFLKDPGAAEQRLRDIARNSNIQQIDLEVSIQQLQQFLPQNLRNMDGIDVPLNQAITEVERILFSEKRVSGPDLKIVYWLTDWGQTQTDSPWYQDVGGAGSPAILKDAQGNLIPVEEQITGVHLNPLHPKVFAPLQRVALTLTNRGIQSIVLDNPLAIDPDQRLVDAMVRANQQNLPPDRTDRSPNPEKWLGDRLNEQFQRLGQDLKVRGAKLAFSSPVLRNAEKLIQQRRDQRPQITPDSEMKPIQEAYHRLQQQLRDLEWCVATQGQSSGGFLNRLPNLSFFSLGSSSAETPNRPNDLSAMNREIETVQGEIASLRETLSAENELRQAFNEDTASIAQQESELEELLGFLQEVPFLTLSLAQSEPNEILEVTAPSGVSNSAGFELD